MINDILFNYSQKCQSIEKDQLNQIVENPDRFYGEIKDRDSYTRGLEHAELNQYQIITCVDSGYPTSLFDLIEIPPVLYLKGNSFDVDSLAFKVGVVGSRKITEWGRDFTKKISEEITGSGGIVISGLAYGADKAAHEGALVASRKNSKRDREFCSGIAVIGSGLGRIYPDQHRYLVDEILDYGGLVISEFPFMCEPFKYNFPKRNRLIAALSDVLLVTEAKEKSGSIITANYSFELGRDVYTLPGRIEDDFYQGNFRIIKEGGKLLTKIEDLLGSFPDIRKEILINIESYKDIKTSDRFINDQNSGAHLKKFQANSQMNSQSKSKFKSINDSITELTDGEKNDTIQYDVTKCDADRYDTDQCQEKLISNRIKNKFNLSNEEDQIITFLSSGAQSINNITHSLSLDHSKIACALSSLEIKGIIREITGARFELCS